MQTVAVVIVTWNSEKDIGICLQSLGEQDYDNTKIIVVDNNSSDSTEKIVKQFPTVIFIKRDKNYFLSPSNNFGIKYAIEKLLAPYILVLNPDTKASTNLISVLVKKINTDRKIGAVGPKIKFFNNKNEGLINSAGLFYDGFLEAYDIGFMQKDIGQFEEEKEVFGVSGAGILYKTEMLNDIGLYWEKINMYMDEVELFIRARKRGWKVLYVPETVLWHSYMRSTDQNKIYKMQSYKKKAWLKIALRHYPLFKKFGAVKQIFFTGKQI